MLDDVLRSGDEPAWAVAAPDDAGTDAASAAAVELPTQAAVVDGTARPAVAPDDPVLVPDPPLHLPPG